MRNVIIDIVKITLGTIALMGLIWVELYCREICLSM